LLNSSCFEFPFIFLSCYWAGLQRKKNLWVVCLTCFFVVGWKFKSK
jgi:hypothetical protein